MPNSKLNYKLNSYLYTAKYLKQILPSTAEHNQHNQLSPGFGAHGRRLQEAEICTRVAIERAKQGEFSATKIVRNGGGKRRESTEIGYVEQPSVYSRKLPQCSHLIPHSANTLRKRKHSNDNVNETSEN
ncbi:hypothetical protein F511_42228 [Dorcoceras hygrometricum]|uniref:Uncharacterized protein n=1 Tax=Dorcoceras hygrometricum TaxID=472368 RepID=A0A2Z7CSU5_9LAMI|nr:hypothetical protein F511_42228 [Dorcoceras hygrometricum]